MGGTGTPPTPPPYIYTLLYRKFLNLNSSNISYFKLNFKFFLVIFPPYIFTFCQREGNPLVFDEGSGVVFVQPKDGCVMLVVVNISGKGKSTYEFRTWDMTAVPAFSARDISVQDIHYSVTNDGKTR